MTTFTIGSFYHHKTLEKVKLIAIYTRPDNEQVYYVQVLQDLPYWFDDDREIFYDLNKYSCWWVKEIYLKPSIELTPEQQVKERIKSLWNKSNWVQKNPSQAY